MPEEEVTEGEGVEEEETPTEEEETVVEEEVVYKYDYSFPAQGDKPFWNPTHVPGEDEHSTLFCDKEDGTGMWHYQTTIERPDLMDEGKFGNIVEREL